MTPHTLLRHARARAIDVREFVQPAGRRIPRHEHAEATILLVLAGEVRDGFGRRTETARPGTLLFRPAGTTHTHAYGDAAAHCVAVSLDGLRYPRLAAKAFGEVVALRIGFGGPELARELRREDCTQPLALESATAELLSLIALAARRAPSYGIPPWLLRVREILHASIDGRPTLDDLVQVAGVHEGHLTRAFREHFGLSIGEYLRDLRVRATARRLLLSEASIAEIALDAGFYDQSHFTRVFRRTLRMTPMEWRRAHLQ